MESAFQEAKCVAPLGVFCQGFGEHKKKKKVARQQYSRRFTWNLSAALIYVQVCCFFVRIVVITACNAKLLEVFRNIQHKSPPPNISKLSDRTTPKNWKRRQVFSAPSWICSECTSKNAWCQGPISSARNTSCPWKTTGKGSSRLQNTAFFQSFAG